MNDPTPDSEDYLRAHLKDPIDYLYPHKLAFDFSNTPLYWKDNSPFKSFFENAFSIALPLLEDFMIKASLEAKDKIQDENLAAQVDAFCAQEDNHARAHEAFNNHLKSNGFDVDKYTNKWVKIVKKLNEKSLNDRLLASALIEAMTSVIGKFYFKNTPYEVIDPAVHKLLSWHCLEELEHRCIVFDLYKNQASPYNPSFRKTFGFSFTFFTTTMLIMFDSLIKKKSFFKFQTLKDFYWLMKPTGPLIAFLTGYIHFLNKKYDPRKLFDEEELNNIIKTWEEKYQHKLGETYK